MDPKTRLSATRTVWIAFFFSLLAINGNVIFADATWSDFNIVTTLVVSIVALLSTGMIWNWGNLPHVQPSRETRSYEKAKRQDRVGMIFDLLEDDELDALRRRLSDERDGEMVDLGALLNNDSERSRR